MQLIDELRSAYLLASLSPAQLERVAKKARHVHLDEGRVLFSQGDVADRFFFLLKGQVKLYRLSAEGNEKIIEIVGPGHTFAEALMFLSRPRYPVSCAALSPAELIAIDAADFTAMLRDSVDTCMWPATCWRRLRPTPTSTSSRSRRASWPRASRSSQRPSRASSST